MSTALQTEVSTTLLLLLIFKVMNAANASMSGFAFCRFQKSGRSFPASYKASGREDEKEDKIHILDLLRHCTVNSNNDIVMK